MESEVPLSEIESELDRMRDSLEESIRRSPGGPRPNVPEQQADSDDHVVQGGEEESGDLGPMREAVRVAIRNDELDLLLQSLMRAGKKEVFEKICELVAVELG